MLVLSWLMVGWVKMKRGAGTNRRLSDYGTAERLRSRIAPAALNLDFITVNDELSAQTEWLPLQGQIDEFHGVTKLLLVIAVSDLIGVELQGQPVNSDDFHLAVVAESFWKTFCTRLLTDRYRRTDRKLC